MRVPEPFAMMHWAKRRVEKASLCLGASGVPCPPEEEFRARSDLVESTPFSSVGNYYGFPALREAIAKAYGVTPQSVLVSDGTSLANYTALSVLAAPGERILVERPTYATLESIPRFHGARVETFERRPEDGWLPSLEDLRRRCTGASKPVRAVVFTRLHNPSGVELPHAFLEGLAQLAEAGRFHVLFDEVYLDFLEGAIPACRISPRFLSTGSLTKVYGFGGLRVGWVLGAPEVLEPMREFSFYLAVNGSTWAQTVALDVFEAREKLLARSRAIADRGHDILEKWIGGRRDVTWIPPAGGISAFARLSGIEDTARFAQHLFEQHDVALAEGEFFHRPGWVRLSFGIPEDTLREALDRVGRALDTWGARG